MVSKQPLSYVVDLQQRLRNGNLHCPKNVRVLIEDIVREERNLAAGWILVFADDPTTFSKFTRTVGRMLTRLKVLRQIDFHSNRIFIYPAFKTLIAKNVDGLRINFNTLGEQLELWEFSTAIIFQKNKPTTLQTLILIALLLDVIPSSAQ